MKKFCLILLFLSLVLLVLPSPILAQVPCNADTTTCGQKTYDKCTPICKDGMAAYDCYQESNRNCQGVVLCDSENSRCSLDITPSALCNNTDNNYMDINAGWNASNAQSFLVSLYAVPGGAISTKCVDKTTYSHTFSGNYPSTDKFEVAITAYDKPNCEGAIISSSKEQVMNAYCDPSQTEKPQDYTLDGLRFAGMILDLTGKQSLKYHLNGKEGEPKAIPVNILAYFNKGADKLTKPYVINFVYRPKEGSTSLIYNISPAPGLVSVNKKAGVTFKWSALENAKKYRLIVAPNPPLHGPSDIDNNCPAPYEGYLVCKELTDTSYTVSADILIDGIDNNWWVAAFDEKGNAIESQKWIVVISGAHPKPEEATCADVTCATNLQGPINNIVYGLSPVSLSWNNPSSEIYRYAKVTAFPGNGGPGVIGKIIKSQSGFNTFTIPAPNINTGNFILLPGTTYRWYVDLAKESSDFWAIDTKGFLKRSSVRGSDFKISNPTSVTIKAVEPTNNGIVNTLTPTLRWNNDNTAIFYYEVQLSKDRTFNQDPKTATASVQHMYIHGAETTPVNSYHVPDAYKLDSNSTYFWRVRPRVGDEGPGVEWSNIWSFKTP